jgi:hypothetical protein
LSPVAFAVWQTYNARPQDGKLFKRSPMGRKTWLARLQAVNDLPKLSRPDGTGNPTNSFIGSRKDDTVNMAKSFNELREKMSPERRARNEALAEQMIAEIALQELHQSGNLTQEQITDDELVANAEAVFLELDQREKQ